MKYNNSALLNVLMISGFCILYMTGCSDNGTGSEESEEYYIQITSTQSHGDILTDGDANALYAFILDVKGQSMCEGDCSNTWPPLDEEDVEVREGLDATDFGTISRPDGGSQVTFKGWPLYYFSGDNQPSDINGDGTGGKWYVASPDYSLMVGSEQLVGNDGKNYIIDSNGNYVEGEGITAYFTDIEGRTLYIFVHDSANTNTFTKEDFSNDGAWPIFYVERDALPSGLNAQDFGEITVYGKKQLTYKGWPVYYFGQDIERGDTKGVSVPRPGVWPVLNGDIPPAPYIFKIE